MESLQFILPKEFFTSQRFFSKGCIYQSDLPIWDPFMAHLTKVFVELLLGEFSNYVLRFFSWCLSFCLFGSTPFGFRALFTQDIYFGWGLVAMGAVMGSKMLWSQGPAR